MIPNTRSNKNDDDTEMETSQRRSTTIPSLPRGNHLPTTTSTKTGPLGLSFWGSNAGGTTTMTREENDNDNNHRAKTKQWWSLPQKKKTSSSKNYKRKHKTKKWTSMLVLNCTLGSAILVVCLWRPLVWSTTTTTTSLHSTTATATTTTMIRSSSGGTTTTTTAHWNANQEENPQPQPPHVSAGTTSSVDSSSKVSSLVSPQSSSSTTTTTTNGIHHDPVPETTTTTSGSTTTTTSTATSTPTIRTPQQQQQQVSPQSNLPLGASSSSSRFTAASSSPSNLTSTTVSATTNSSYADQVRAVTVGDPNAKTLAYVQMQFYAGFVNQLMAFTALVMDATTRNCTQLVLPSLQWKDLYGNNFTWPHEHLFDVVHWNTHAAVVQDQPVLPKLVQRDASMIHLATQTRHGTEGELWWHTSVQHVITPAHRRRRHVKRIQIVNATRPYASEKQHVYFLRYSSYTKQVQGAAKLEQRRRPQLEQLEQEQSQKTIHKQQQNLQAPQRKLPPRHAADLAILQGALQPHPDLRRMIEVVKQGMVPTTPSISSSSSSSGYLCLHARIEPDMQVHPYCPQYKVTQLRDIVQHLYTTFPQGPPPGIDRVLLVLNRPLLERHVQTLRMRGSASSSDSTAAVALDNLELLNTIRDTGLWNGTVPVHEAGQSALTVHSWHARHAAILSASIVDYFLGVDAAMFIGTPVSSFSMQLVATRHARWNNRQHNDGPEPPRDDYSNYLYLPDGLWKVPSDQEPPPFEC